MKLFFKLGAILFVTIGLSQEKSKNISEKLYISEKKYSILFPYNWYLQKTDSLGNKFMLLSPKSDVKDNFIENISLLISDIGYSKVKPKTIKKIVDKRFGVSSEIISNRKVLKNGLEGQEIVYKQLMSNGSLGTFLQYYFIKERDLYILTFCSKSEEFLFYMPIFQRTYEHFDIR
ncbi:PsbP-related protein [Flavobacterium fluviatile]|uniref:PsbP-related protein n=1 Tax=Flavobacterium fluviatile TaxID=1862387 RepID=UPI0013D114A2|nr:hypothetical protein [Flavobacterium fluviatile]